MHAGWLNIVDLPWENQIAPRIGGRAQRPQWSDHPCPDDTLHSPRAAVSAAFGITVNASSNHLLKPLEHAKGAYGALGVMIALTSWVIWRERGRQADEVAGRSPD